MAGQEPHEIILSYARPVSPDMIELFASGSRSLLRPRMPLADRMPSSEEFDFTALRAEMVETIAAEARLVGALIGRDRFDARVMAAMASVPRHDFVPAELRELAYVNVPLPIGFGKTISQPFIVALMTELLEIDDTDAVLEIGTGLGYQAAILSELADRVYTMEIIEELARLRAYRVPDR